MKKKRLLTDKSGTLQEEIMEQAARRMAEDIDAQVVRGLLKDSGWHEVVLDWIMTHEVSKEVDDWVSAHAKEEFWNRGLVWLFKCDTDAMWFKLRWLG